MGGGARYTNFVKSLKEYIVEAAAKETAIGHFNFSDSEQLTAIFNAARTLGVPVIAGVSEGERDFIGVRQSVALVRSLRETHDYPVFLNADHTYSFERVKEAVDAGFDAVIFDGAKLSLEENIAVTKQCVEYAKKRSASVGTDILVEGELGYIGTSSKLLEDIPEGAAVTREAMTHPDELVRFVKETGVDLVAPSVGNIHGMLKNVPNPHLDIALIQELKRASGVPLVLHGGSGITEDDFTAAIKAGISLIHINTEIRLAYRRGIEASLAQDVDEVAPYRFMSGGLHAVKEAVEARLKLFSGRS